MEALRAPPLNPKPGARAQVVDGFDLEALRALSPTGTFTKIFVDIGGTAGGTAHAWAVQRVGRSRALGFAGLGFRGDRSVPYLPQSTCGETG